MQSQSGRQLGVTVSSNQLNASGTGEPKTIQHMHPVEMHAIQYADDMGQLHNELVMVIGTQVYLFPNGESFAASLRPASKWLAERVFKNLASASAPLPAHDMVDVLDPSQDPLNTAAADAHHQTSK